MCIFYMLVVVFILWKCYKFCTFNKIAFKKQITCSRSDIRMIQNWPKMKPSTCKMRLWPPYFCCNWFSIWSRESFATSNKLLVLTNFVWCVRSKCILFFIEYDKHLFTLSTTKSWLRCYNLWKRLKALKWKIYSLFYFQ
jgi:hypothetical protein